MKGCLDVLIKSSTFFVFFFVFGLIIGLLMMGEPPLANQKQLNEMTKEERLEVFQYHEKFRVSSSLAGFLSLPLSALSTYLIFRKRTKN